MKELFHTHAPDSLQATRLIRAPWGCRVHLKRRNASFLPSKSPTKDTHLSRWQGFNCSRLRSVALA